MREPNEHLIRLYPTSCHRPFRQCIESEQQRCDELHEGHVSRHHNQQYLELMAKLYNHWAQLRAPTILSHFLLSLHRTVAVEKCIGDEFGKAWLLGNRSWALVFICMWDLEGYLTIFNGPWWSLMIRELATPLATLDFTSAPRLSDGSVILIPSDPLLQHTDSTLCIADTSDCLVSFSLLIYCFTLRWLLFYMYDTISIPFGTYPMPNPFAWLLYTRYPSPYTTRI